MLKFLKDKLVNYIFSNVFFGYVFPFNTADDKLEKMNQAQRNNYYREAQELLGMKVYQSEIEELIRHFYNELAIKTKDEKDMTAYRLTLLMLQKLNNRIQFLAQMYREPELPNNLNAL